MSDLTDTDIVISGGGPAGLSAAAILGAQGARITLLDPAPPVTQMDAPGADLRTTAILQPGRALFEEAGVWDHLAPHATPLDQMRIINAAERHVSRDFNSSDLSEQAFGWNFPNTALRAALMERLDSLPNVTFLAGTGYAGHIARSGEVRVRMTDGSQTRAKLLLACDGRESPVRAAAGIKVTRLRYGQVAVTFAATHPQPHHNVSTEIHLRGGPFTLVPLPDYDGQPCSAVVWMTDGPEAAKLMALDDDAFAAAASERATFLLGPLTLVQRRQSWPIIAQIADKFCGARVALAAEAAHVVPPIGAQGLNMSLADLGCLKRLLDGAGDPGDADLLTRYHRRRWPEAQLRVRGVDLLNRASQTGIAPLQAARGAGLALLHDVKPVRQALMRMGLGAR